MTVDDLLGLATSMGVTIGDLLDPPGPDHRRQLSLDVGLVGAAPMTPQAGHLWAKSHAVVRFTGAEHLSSKSRPEPTVWSDPSAARARFPPARRVE